MSDDDIGFLRVVARRGQWLVRSYAERPEAERLCDAGLLRRMSPLRSMAPGYEITDRGLAAAAARPDRAEGP